MFVFIAILLLPIKTLCCLTKMKVFFLLLVVGLTKRYYCEVICSNPSGKDWEIELVLTHQDCNKFYKCFQGKALEVLCPRGLYFNIKYWRCDWKRNVNCSGRNIPKETDSLDDDDILNITESDSEDAENDENLDNEDDQEDEAVNTDLVFFRNGCPVNTLKQWRIPHETDCNQFYTCHWAIKRKKRCPPYLHFNKKLQVCDWPRVAGCDE